MLKLVASLALAVLIADGQAAYAAGRIYCATSDAVLNMSLESGFSKKDAKKLVHFRGIAAVKGPDAPPELGRFEINSEMLQQYWMDGKEMRFQIRAFLPEKKPTAQVELSVITQRGSDQEASFKGSYALKVSRLAVDKKAPRETIISHEAPIFCAIK
ncbi:hypothetical protein [Rhizobium sp. CECT 9324]|uniref:hypothetical protein n=1 Tax=Rhizobium sp. CECT 9324 TaxID=2845820 RepID=UPI001E658F0E|nr:hypothetical protein [Rhizobium sp. CECT 9324]CAH0339656.1 hypothetical protein RHI9324_01307 [Rhizobium sp. CECT 9324]